MPVDLLRNVRGRAVVNCRADAVPSAAELESNGARLLNLAGDDLLGLACDTRVRNAASAAVKDHGLTAISGGRLQHALEARAASLLGAPAALVIAHESALLELLPSLRLLTEERGRRVLGDAAQVSSPAEADTALNQQGIVGVVLEALHPLEGDLSMVPRYAEVCQRHHARLVVIDDALGVLGPNGGGAIEHLSLSAQTAVRIVPLGGAIPGAGALVLGEPAFIEALRDVLPVPPAPMLAASTKALEISAAEGTRRARLFDVAQKMIAGLRSRGFDTGPAVTPWIPAWIGDEALCVQWLETLAEHSIACRGWLAGPRSRLLLTPGATLTDAQVNQALEVFERLARKLALPDASSVTKDAPVLARPGSYAFGAPAAMHWTTVDPRERRPMDATTQSPTVTPSMPENLSLRDRVFDAVETVTWRATNVGGGQLRRGADALRALFDKKRD
mgnify:CR=1 FL=1